jgi:hypothetical protein
MFRSTILLVFLCVLLAISEGAPLITCGPVCQIYCKHGNEIDKNGCELCKCKTSPCEDGQTPLAGDNCNNGSEQTNCPLTYECIITPLDGYGYCCPPLRSTTSSMATNI